MKRGRLHKSDICAYKNIEGAWVIYAMVGNDFRKMRYYYYTKQEAIEDFFHRYGSAQLTA